MGDANYYIPDYTGNLNWRTTNENIATIDNGGHLIANGNGFTSIIAEFYANGQLFRKEKDIMVNFPDIVIRHTYYADSGYTFTATSTNEEANTLMSQLVSNGNFHYEWSMINSEGEMLTQTSDSNIFTYLPSTDESITIAVRLVNEEGEKGPIKSLNLNLKTPMSVNYKYVIVDSQQNTYFIKNDNTYEIGMPSEDLVVSLRQLAINPSDNINLISLRDKYLKGNDCYISYPSGVGATNYMLGVLQQPYMKWSFDFFEKPIFINELANALRHTNGEERTMSEFCLTICNTNKEKLQELPFAIIYKPCFPEY